MSILKEAVGVARAHFLNEDITVEFVRRNTKERMVTEVRYFIIAYIRACDPKRYSYPMMARIVGLGHHTTVLHGLRRAHRIWGEAYFKRLAFGRLTKGASSTQIPQAIHIAPSMSDILARGEELLRSELAAVRVFTNGQGWRDAA